MYISINSFALSNIIRTHTVDHLNTEIDHVIIIMDHLTTYLITAQFMSINHISNIC